MDMALTRTLPAGRARSGNRFLGYRLRVATMGGAEQAVDVDRPELRVGTHPSCDLVLADEAVSRLHFEIRVEPDGYRLVDLGSRNGTFVDGFRARDLHLRPTAAIAAGRTRLLFEPRDVELEVEASDRDGFGALLGQSPPMRALFAVLERVAPSHVPVLVEGETGTGKELVARSLHENGTRAGKPFVVLDCAAIPGNLMPSLLFGHVRGAFTGADEDRAGAFEEADGGTLFLDELGELPSDLQPRLLRAVETLTVTPIGSSEERRVDVRLVAATNRDLAAEVNRGAFRADLYHRLAVVRVTVPPLRDRPDDVRMLAERFVRQRHDPASGDRAIAAVPADVWRRLEQNDWRGNVRQLKNAIEAALALWDPGEPLDLLPRAAAAPSHSTRPPDLERAFLEQRAEVLARFESTYVQSMLERHGGNVSRAAQAAGLDRAYFGRILRRHRGKG
jgi:DNA-binding NtrC family response regulator